MYLYSFAFTANLKNDKADIKHLLMDSRFVYLSDVHAIYETNCYQYCWVSIHHLRANQLLLTMPVPGLIRVGAECQLVSCSGANNMSVPPGFVCAHACFTIYLGRTARAFVQM